MTIATRRRAGCRLCQGRALEPILALTPTPPANAFVAASELAKEQPVFPLEVFLCRGCGHVQLLDIVDRRELFEDYVYTSGTSPVFVDHFRRYAATMIEDLGLARQSLVVDIGSNDGTLLGFLKDAGMRVVGVDPAKEIARRATESGIETRAAFFTPELARELRAAFGEAALVTANNVFAHADDLVGIVEGVKELLRPDGVFVFEVSYLVDVYERTLFDTIYHEHLSYHSVKPLPTFFAETGMELIDVTRVDTHGGSIRGLVQKVGAPRRVRPSVGELISLEDDLRLAKPGTFRAFATAIARIKSELVDLLRTLKTDGRRIAGYGAPAKATTLAYHFDLDSEVIEFIVDDSPLKQGLYTPGKHIPVLPPSALYERNCDYLVILAWNFARSIVRKHEAFRRKGGHFIVPLPEVEVI